VTKIKKLRKIGLSFAIKFFLLVILFFDDLHETKKPQTVNGLRLPINFIFRA